MSFHSHNGTSVSVVAWGEPSDPRTFSGCSRSLTQALKCRHMLRGEFSAKRLAMTDALAGAFCVRMAGRRPRVEVSRSWMWSQRGSGTLSRRLNRVLRDSGDRGPILQVGTLVDVDPEIGEHYVLTDMTITQAAGAGMFAIGSLKGRKLNEALAVQERVLRNAAHVFTFTEWARQSVVEGFGVNADRVTVVYAGSNLHLPDQGGRKSNGREILFVGIDWQRKGGPLLVEAFKLVRRRLPDATLRIVGCWPDVDEPGVHVEGFLSRRNPAEVRRLGELYSRASCFCLPSLFDPFPTAIIEAASVGLATVAIDNGSRREAIVNGQTGVLAVEPTAQSVAEALHTVLADRDRCRELGEAARQFASKHFTWDRVVEKIERVIHKAPAREREPLAAASLA